MGTQSQLLDGARLFLGNPGWTDVLRAATGARIQEWILVREIVKAALRDDLDNRQRLVAQNSDGQFPPRNEFLHQKFAVVGRSIGNGSIHVAFVSNDVHADR